MKDIEFLKKRKNKEGGLKKMLGIKERFLTVPEIANKLGFAYITVYGWVKSGKLKSYNFNGSFRITEKDFQAFVKAGKGNKLKEVAK